MSSKYEDLIKYVKQTEALSHASGLIAWDQETKMPKGSVEQRADTLSVLESEIHKRKSNKYIEELLISSPMDALLYQKELLDVLQILNTQRRALMDSRAQLSKLMGLLPIQEYI